jgi:hypothetical protein
LTPFSFRGFSRLRSPTGTQDPTDRQALPLAICHDIMDFSKREDTS